MLNLTKWNDYKKGEVACFGWKLERVQVRLNDKHYISNFVDYVSSNNRLLLDIDKILLFGEGKPIAIYPYNAENLTDITVYLDSIKNTDIHTVVLSLGENSGVFVNSDLIEEVLDELNAKTKMEVRYLLSE
jgi:hypothetical protein